MAFVIDTRGTHGLTDNSTHFADDNVEDSDDDFMFIPLKGATAPTSSAQDKSDDFSESYFDFEPRKKLRRAVLKKKPKEQFKTADKIIEESDTLQAGAEKLATEPLNTKGIRGQLRQRKAERERRKGANWFNLPAPEVTEEIQNDIETLRMRSALDPKHFYKKNDMKHIPKYFQIGKVVDSPADYYSSRIPKKERKRTLVDDLLADAEFQRQTKRRYKEIVAERQKYDFKSVRESRRLQRKSKPKKGRK